MTVGANAADATTICRYFFDQIGSQPTVDHWEALGGFSQFTVTQEWEVPQCDLALVAKSVPSLNLSESYVRYSGG
jgi:hypothetical protein